MHFNRDGNNLITEFIFGDTNIDDKIINMRVYPDVKFDEDNPNWWESLRDRFGEKTVDDYRDSYKTEMHKGIVVKYE